VAVVADRAVPPQASRWDLDRRHRRRRRTKLEPSRHPAERAVPLVDLEATVRRGPIRHTPPQSHPPHTPVKPRPGVPARTRRRRGLEARERWPGSKARLPPTSRANRALTRVQDGGCRSAGATSPTAGPTTRDAPNGQCPLVRGVVAFWRRDRMCGPGSLDSRRLAGRETNRGRDSMLRAADWRPIARRRRRTRGCLRAPTASRRRRAPSPSARRTGGHGDSHGGGRRQCGSLAPRSLERHTS
jgi:hypothetical protein